MHTREWDVSKKCVMVGDDFIRKKSLLASCSKAPDDYLVGFCTCLRVKATRVQLHVWDTQGQEDFDFLRYQTYTNAAVVLICFALSSRTSFESVRLRWHPEVSRRCANASIVLVGIRPDSQGHEGREWVSRRHIKDLVKELSIKKYIECSDVEQESLQALLEKVAKLTIR